jgi:hypothetical protein
MEQSEIDKIRAPRFDKPQRTDLRQPSERMKPSRSNDGGKVSTK